MPPAGWTEAGGRLRRSFAFADFAEAWGFLSRVALLAERLDHHPTWSNTWNRVDVELTTHDAGDVVTERDVAFAEGVNRILGEAPPPGS